MKICVTSSGDKLDSDLDARFGRCAYFIIIDAESMKFKALKNPNLATGGAGIQSAQLVASEKVKAVVTGNAGPNAFTVLNSFGIKVFSSPGGKISDVVRDFKEGKLKELKNSNVSSHFGLG